MALPTPEPDALAASRQVEQLIAAEIEAAGGWISFARYMELSLYAPGLGYYCGGARKFGSEGDFVTAPEISGLFGRSLVTQLMQAMSYSAPQVLEAGAGSGRLAADLLAEFERRGSLPERYRILELSADLRERQSQTISASVPHLCRRVEWIDRFPDRFSGIVIGNEILDALPIHLLVWRQPVPFERGVALNADRLPEWSEREATGAVRAAAEALAGELEPAPGFTLELALAARAWLAEWGRCLNSGVILLFDYGFPRREFYHEQRHSGTLMCHYRHHAHADPFYLPGLQDITAHVDFTATAESLHSAGLDILGYSSQASFLINCGLFDQLSRLEPGSREYIREAGAVNKLTSPAEMGELFKVIAAGRGIDQPLVGFQRGDRLHAL